MAKKRKAVATAPPENEKTNTKAVDGGVKKQKRLAGRQGALRYIMEIPLDVLFEILGYLDPIDILRLSRTSKGLRRILLCRSSMSVWKAARRNLKVPDPIPSMSEPKFANFLFDPRCHFCLTATVHNIAWWAKLRCCKACLPIYFASAYEIHERGLLVSLDIESILWKALPRYPLDSGSCGQRQWRRVNEVYLISGAEELSPHVSDIETVESTKWIVTRLESLMHDMEQSTMCKHWMDNRNSNRERELSDARELRFNAIVAKLEASGWDHELTFAIGREDLRKHKLVNQPKPLTDRIWQNIEQPIAEFMETVKSERLKREHKAICGKRYKVLICLLREREKYLQDEQVMPSSVDVACWEPIKSMIEGPPKEDEGELTMYNEALKELPQFIQDWNREKTRLLLAALQAEKPEATEADLRLATTVFRCQHALCMRYSVAPFPGILTHRACHYRGLEPNPLPKWLPYNARLSSDCKFGLHKSGSESIRNIIGLCGLDPRTTTAEDMLAMNPLLECKECTTESGVRLFMRWTRAITHRHDDDDENPASAAPQFVLASEKEEKLVGAHESSQDRDTYQYRDRPWYRCQHCRGACGTLNRVKRHLKEVHDIQTLTETDSQNFRFMGHLNLEGPFAVRVIPPGVRDLDSDLNFDSSSLYL
ncbi:hypothetical protein E1B28_012818 [Marasmius oreades]|uniref:F-box domain-containing protein n=1 Tax=Marasmius oreades TaxID=181124 RepID=A0A9P7UR70_9AGAR|nr:uncharacterized protein E1B28_012818 [Marasmius oreades]KAG7088864.1 hypothetical protein E1B28_012818 [Marasmius oreades]